MPCRSRFRRAFSLLEVAAATSLFAIVSIGVSLAITSALGSRASSAIEFRLRGELDKALIELSYTPFAEILANEFTPPSPCAASSLQGTSGTSCFTVADRNFVATWATVFALDAVESSTEAVDSVVLVATVSLPDGRGVSRSRRVAAPTPGFNGESLLRAQFSGAFADRAAPVFLVLADAPATVVSSAKVSSFGSALFRVAPDACTAAAPCRLALAPGNAWSSDGDYALSASSSVGDAAKIVLDAGKVHQVGAEIYPVLDLVVSLLARSDSGMEAPPTVENSICLWASFNDGVADRLVPACNNDAAGSVRFSSYAIDPLQPAFRARIPRGAQVRLYVDRPNGVCPNLGQLGSRAGLWEPAAVCTSWTWGVPSTLRLAGTGADFSTSFRPVDDTTVVAVWSGNLARPAVGFDDRPLWVNPRAYAACTTTVSCTPSFSTAPESSLCPDSLCLASRLPTLLAPSTGSVYAKQVVSSTTVFDLTVVDEYGDPVQVQVLDLPQSGSLLFDGSEVAAGDVLGTTDGPAAGSFELTFVEDSEIDMVFFTVRISNDVDDGVRDVDVALYRNARPWIFSTRKGMVAQDGSATLAFSVVGTDSNPSSGESITLSAPSGFTLPATAVSNGSGVVSFSLAAGAVPAGNYAVSLSTASGRTASIPVTVEQAAGSMTVSAPDLAQGATSSVSVSVLDRVGSPMESGLVAFATNASGTGFASGVRTSPSGCITNASGACSVALIAESGALSGVYTMTVHSGSISATDTFVVSSVPARLSPAALTVSQDASSSWALTVKDGSGAVLAGRTVSVVSAPSGVSLTPASATSDASGVVSFSVAVSAAASPGSTSVSFTVDGVALSASFTVAQKPTSIVLPAQITLQRGASVSTSVRVLDASGNPISGLSFSFTSSAGVRSSSLPSNADGYATVALSASDSAVKGSRTVVFATVSSPAITSGLSVDVVAAPASVSLIGSVPQSGRSALVVAVFDADGDPVQNAVVQLSGLPSAISISPRALTDSSGVASIPVLDTAATALGTYRGSLRVTLNDAPHLFSVAVSVAAVGSSLSSPAAMPAPSPVALSASEISVPLEPPTNTGGAAVSSYRVYVNGALAASPVASPGVIPGLAANTVYTVAVAACNTTGCSPASATSNVRTFPAQLTGLAAAPNGTSGVLQVSWTLPVDAPEATLLRVKLASSVSWLSPRLVSSASSSYKLTGLTNGVAYDVQVGSRNPSGTSWSASVSATPATPPSPPTAFNAALVDNAPSLSWTAPVSNGGMSLTAIQVYRNRSLLATIASSAIAYVDAAAPNGTYVYAVAACNALGCSPATAARAVAVQSPPAAPAAASVSSVSASGFTVSWSATATATSYQVLLNAGQITSTSSTSYVASSLAAGTSFSVQVKACNSVGCSSASPATLTSTRPLAPTGLALDSQDGELVASWTASASPVVDGYRVWFREGTSGAFSEWTAGVSDSSPTTVSGLVNGTSYQVYVEAFNDGGATASSTVAAVPAAPPSTPAAPTPSPLAAAVSLAWSAPTSDGGAEITDYEVESSFDGGLTWSPELTSSTSPATVTGLTNGVGYVFRVAAVNSAGTGPFSDSSVQSVPRTTASAPLDVNGTEGAGFVELGWSAPTSDGGAAVSDYVVQFSANDGATWSLFTDGTSSVSSATVTGLTNGVGYVFRVAAVNSAGTGAFSLVSPEVVPRTTPTQPATPTAGTVSVSSVEVLWSTPASNGGSTLTGFTLYRNATLIASLSASSTSYTDSSRTAGTNYSYQVAAVNVAGSSSLSTALTIATLPDAPTALLASTANQAVTLSWTESVSPVVSGYKVYYRAGTIGSYTEWTAGTNDTSPTTITGLSNGTTYEAYVSSYNATGTGPASASVSATPAIPCADGGPCAVGDTGPGGGVVFYVNNAGFTCYSSTWSASPSTTSRTCTYLEAAPADAAVSRWSANEYNSAGTVAGLGWGEYNTVRSFLMYHWYANVGFATYTARAYGNNGKYDWYLPSKVELNELCKYARQQTTGDTSVACAATGSLRTGFPGSYGYYWSSTEANNYQVVIQTFADGSTTVGNKPDYGTASAGVRPIRGG